MQSLTTHLSLSFSFPLSFGSLSALESFSVMKSVVSTKCPAMSYQRNNSHIPPW